MPSPSLAEVFRDVSGSSLSGEESCSWNLKEAQLVELLERAYEAGRSSCFRQPEASPGQESRLFGDRSGSLDRQRPGDAQIAHWREMAGFFQQLMDSLPDMVYFKDRESRFICVNQAHAVEKGASGPSDLLGHTDHDYFSHEFADQKRAVEEEIMRTGRGWYFREEFHRHSNGDERWVLSTKLPLRSEEGEIVGTFGISHDITEKKHAEIELERQRNLLDTVFHILPCRMFVRDVEGRYVLINEEYRRSLNLPSGDAAVGRHLSDFRPDEKAAAIEAEDRMIIRTGHAIINSVDYDRSPIDHRRWILTSKVPLRDSAGKIEGLVGMTLDVTEQKEAENRARQAMEALSERNRQMETELMVARQLQEHLMSVGFERDTSFTRMGSGWQLDAGYWYQPSHHLAGDFFYLLPLGEQKFAVMICDVMGHGVKAALITMLIRGMLLEIPEILGQPDKVLDCLNSKLQPLADHPDFPRFTTALYMVIDLAKGVCLHANAGHPTLLFNLNGSFQRCVHTPGPALGLLPDIPFPCSQILLAPKTEFLLYTDGIIEQENRAEEEFGENRLTQTLNQFSGQGPRAQLEALKRRVSGFSNSVIYDDDICVVSLMVKTVS